MYRMYSTLCTVLMVVMRDDGKLPPPCGEISSQLLGVTSDFYVHR